MKEPGINVNIFHSHSARSALPSKYKISQLLLNEIKKSAGRSNEKTFAQFFDKPIQEDFSSYLFRWNLLLFYIYMCIYGVTYKGNIYGANYAGNNINQIEKNPGLLIISQITVYTRELETN